MIKDIIIYLSASASALPRRAFYEVALGGRARL
jgi:hypothetical protein